MPDLILAAYGSPAAAFAAGERLAALQKASGVEPQDIAVITRGGPGRVSVHQSTDAATGRPIGGGQWGALIGMLFLDARHPTGQGRGLAEQLLASGLEADFLQKVLALLTPQGAVVGLMVRTLGVDRVRTWLDALEGSPKILQGRISAETEDALRDLQGQVPQLHPGHTDAII